MFVVSSFSAQTNSNTQTKTTNNWSVLGLTRYLKKRNQKVKYVRIHQTTSTNHSRTNTGIQEIRSNTNTETPTLPCYYYDNSNKERSRKREAAAAFTFQNSFYTCALCCCNINNKREALPAGWV
ncbi:hypothetical protein CIPAW_10G167000 [Carya illinoinensis]|uniref:Uncharacterized protein n=1 Tax=Carya illinoinensis TaxID=32201 RepID=A0A8T1P6V6_CARIL|nr:hypothetical protein CIPAW_10G167000 [Carya illinoinensis]